MLVLFLSLSFSVCLPTPLAHLTPLSLSLSLSMTFSVDNRRVCQSYHSVHDPYWRMGLGPDSWCHALREGQSHSQANGGYIQSCMVRTLI